MATLYNALYTDRFGGHRCHVRYKLKMPSLLLGMDTDLYFRKRSLLNKSCWHKLLMLYVFMGLKGCYSCLALCWELEDRRASRSSLCVIHSRDMQWQLQILRSSILIQEWRLSLGPLLNGACHNLNAPPLTMAQPHKFWFLQLFSVFLPGWVYI